MTMMKIACIELTSVPDMVFEAQMYPRGSNSIFQITDTQREGMPEHAYYKVTHGLRDKIIWMHFV